MYSWAERCGWCFWFFVVRSGRYSIAWMDFSAMNTSDMNDQNNLFFQRQGTQRPSQCAQWLRRSKPLTAVVLAIFAAGAGVPLAGSIAATSTTGQGATFIVTLPVTQAAAEYAP